MLHCSLRSAHCVKGRKLPETTESSPRISEQDIWYAEAYAHTRRHGRPLVTAGAARPTAIASAPAFRGLEADRRTSLADWATPVAGVIIISTELKRGSQRRLISRAMSMEQV